MTESPGEGKTKQTKEDTMPVIVDTERSEEWLAQHRHKLPLRVRTICWLALFMNAAPSHRVEYRLVAAVFLRLLALIYLAAFASIGGQIAGLAGPEGILPAAHILAAARTEADSVWLHPTLFWFGTSGQMLEGAAGLGGILAVALFFNLLPRLCLIGMFVLYLSLSHAAPSFMTDPGDYLLLEAGFLAIFLASGATRPVIGLYRWLLGRILFLSGVLKILGPEKAAWTDLTALGRLFETQPLPHVGAWFAHNLPESALQTVTSAVLFVELVGPFLLFLPRGPRFLMAWAVMVLQSGLMLTGNHGLTNSLMLGLCVLLFDDLALERMAPWSLLQFLSPWRPPAQGSLLRALLVACVAGVTLTVSSLQVLEALSGRRPPPSLAALIDRLQPFHLVNTYTLWPALPPQRLELVVEGSNDGIHWRPYNFAYKPGEPGTRPPITLLHQPRLDWLMVSAAQGDAHARSVVFRSFLSHLRHGNQTVTSLCIRNPFFGSKPRQVRVILYRYSFTNPTTRAATGHWWQRETLRIFMLETIFPFAGKDSP